MIAAAETETSSHNAALKRRTTMSGHRIPETALAENCSGFFDASRYEDLPCRFFFAERRPTLQVADSTSFFSGIRVALIPLRATLVNKEDCLHEKATHLGMLLGLLTVSGVAQRGRPGGAVSPTARPDIDLGARRSAGGSPTLAPNRTITNRSVSPTAGPVRDPRVDKTATIAPDGTTVNRNVDPTAAPIRDPLAKPSATPGASTTVNRNASPTAEAPIRDPK